jgi:hypothetical protein
MAMQTADLHQIPGSFPDWKTVRTKTASDSDGSIFAGLDETAIKGQVK